jgi:hypothetical protein
VGSVEVFAVGWAVARMIEKVTGRDLAKELGLDLLMGSGTEKVKDLGSRMATKRDSEMEKVKVLEKDLEKDIYQS